MDGSDDSDEEEELDTREPAFMVSHMITSMLPYIAIVDIKVVSCLDSHNMHYSLCFAVGCKYKLE